jgi:hydroxymethylpyrimidine pyrophosphatase-like HAD family hydrolase
MEKQFQECNNSKKIPQKISFAIFDVDGTLREIIGNGKTKKVAQDILEKLIRIAQKGVNIGIITGSSLSQIKDRFCDLFVDPRWQQIKDKFSFYGELGLLECDMDNDKVIINEKFLNHPIRNTDFRQKVYDFILDKNRVSSWAPIIPEIRDKAIMLNYAVAKPNLDHNAEEKAHQKLFDDFKQFLQDIKCDFVYPIKGPTFIDITLKLSDGSFWDKDDACGRVISQWAKKFNKSVEEVENTCIAFGDSLSDIKMALPKYEDFKLGNVAFAYVGAKEYFNPTPEQKNNIVLCSLASQDENLPWGPVITGQILDYLDDKFLAY